MLRTALTAALAATIAGPVLADAHIADMDDLIRTRDITGGPVYSIAADYDETVWMDREAADPYTYESYAYGTDVDQIGEIEDIVLDTSGEMQGVVLEVGGFLDIGDKHVMVPVSDLRLTAVDDQTYSFVTRLSEEQLEELPGVDEGWFD